MVCTSVQYVASDLTRNRVCTDTWQDHIQWKQACLFVALKNLIFPALLQKSKNELCHQNKHHVTFAACRWNVCPSMLSGSTIQIKETPSLSCARCVEPASRDSLATSSTSPGTPGRRSTAASCVANSSDLSQIRTTANGVTRYSSMRCSALHLHH